MAPASVSVRSLHVQRERVPRWRPLPAIAVAFESETSKASKRGGRTLFGGPRDACGRMQKLTEEGNCGSRSWTGNSGQCKFSLQPGGSPAAAAAAIELGRGSCSPFLRIMRIENRTRKLPFATTPAVCLTRCRVTICTSLDVTGKGTALVFTSCKGRGTKQSPSKDAQRTC